MKRLELVNIKIIQFSCIHYIVWIWHLKIIICFDFHRNILPSFMVQFVEPDDFRPKYNMGKHKLKQIDGTNIN